MGIVKTYEELQKVIDEYYSTGKIASFLHPDKQESRTQLIKNTIGFGDGLNHVRTSHYLKNSLNAIETDKTKSIKFSMRFFIKYALMEIGKFFYIKSLFARLPKFKKTIWIFERYRLSRIPKLKQEYYKCLDKFYQDRNLDSKIKHKEFWKALF